MEISHLTQAPLRGVIPVAVSNRTKKMPPFLGITPENVSLFKMAYLAQKNGESYDGFERRVLQVVDR